MFKWMTALGLVFVCSGTGTAFALESTGPQTITEMGCDNVDTLCHVTISGAPVGSTLGCASNVILWDIASDANGKATYASLLSAFVAGKQVNFFVAACMAGRPTLPTISYYQVSS